MHTSSKEAGFIGFLLSQMEQVKDHPDRELHCFNFDQAYERRKRRYEELTGEEWEGIT